ncbi:MAG: GTPase Era, partial [Bacteroidales bacterium]|nr:GTPase Era [Bacteroidales bacterium]
ALEDADLFILMSEIGAPFDDENIIAQIKKTNTKVILLINKIDLSEQKDLETEVQSWKEKHPEWEVIPVSAEKKFNIDYVLKRIIDLLPESPPYYDKENLTDKPVRFFVGEIIREKILLNYQKEIPYAIEVVIESFKEEPNIVNIRAVIYTERDTQKGILIGHKGAALKKVGTQARIDIEKFLGQKVFLELNVKVLKNWRESQSMLSRFGYIKK